MKSGCGGNKLFRHLGTNCPDCRGGPGLKKNWFMAHAVAVDPTTTVMSCNVIDFCHETLGSITHEPFDEND